MTYIFIDQIRYFMDKTLRSIVLTFILMTLNGRQN